MILCVVLQALPAQAESVRVVASIKPVHSLVAMVLAGITDPELIVKNAGSPHGYAMRPSDARTLAAADAVFWIGPGLETFLVKPLASLAADARTVALMEDDGHAEHGATDHGGHEHSDDEHSDEAHAHAHGADPHIWLSAGRAVEMIERIAAVMTEIIPSQAERIAQNRIHAIDELIDVDAEVRRLVMPLHDEDIVVLHEAYGHFTRHYELRDFIALSISPEHKPTPGRIREVRREIARLNIRCVLAEPQFPDTFVTLLTENSNARPGVIDPLGAQLMPGPDLYAQLLRLMGFAIRDCTGE
jgi:zinc transport system substrate-binding protein